MKITVLSVGRTGESHIQQGLEHYLTRLRRYVDLDWKEIPDLKASKKLPVSEFQKAEAAKILGAITDRDHVVLLDEKGKQFTSKAFSEWIQAKQLAGVRNLVLVIGGAYGFSPSVYERANGKIALSAMTFPHQLIRLILAEQLYRGFTIIRGEKYHH